MKLLFENWRGYLNEGMKSISELPSDVYIVVRPDPADRGGGLSRSTAAAHGGSGAKVISLARRDIHTGELTKPYADINHAWEEEELYGDVLIVPLEGCQDAWESHSEAASGWGPLLYDIAMEYTTLNGGGLMSGRQGSSPDAQRVWNYYLKNRQDVTAHQLDDKRNSLTPGDDSDNCDQHIEPSKYDPLPPEQQYTRPDRPPGYHARTGRPGSWEDVDPQDPAVWKRKEWLKKIAFSKRYTKEPTTINALGDRFIDLTR